MQRRGFRLIIVMATVLLFASGVAVADTIYGTLNGDTILGTEGSDYINGQNGADYLEGRGGTDTVYGSLGIDTIYGDYSPKFGTPADPKDDADNLYGENGDDTLYGGPGNDTLDGSTDNDTLHGGSGSDKLYGSIGNDTIYADDDDPDSSTDVDTVYGEGGNDTIYAQDKKKDTIYCGYGEDWVYADIVDEFPAPENCEHVSPEITTITSQPPKLTNSTAASFSFNSPDETGATFECSNDNQTWATCTSPYNYSSTPLQDGSHNFYVRAKDAAGNVDKTPASYSWTVDTKAPDTTIGSKPASATRSTSASFSFSSSESNSTFECQLDNGGYSDCSTGSKSYSSLTAGKHTFEVKATDAAGNTDASPASYSWTVDTTAPTVKTVTPPNGAIGVPRTNTSVTASFSEEMKASTITTTNFKLVENATGTRVDATVSCDSPCTTATLKPSQSLTANKKYKAVVTTGAQDVAGNAMTQNKVWYFTTGS